MLVTADLLDSSLQIPRLSILPTPDLLIPSRGLLTLDPAPATQVCLRLA
jgi:hypothetical protein